MLAADHMAYLFEFDSVHGRFDGVVRHCEKSGKKYLCVGGHEIQVFDQKSPSDIPWKDLRVDFVIESSGEFVTCDGAKGHLDAGAKTVLLSAPPKDNLKGVHMPVFVYGVNHSMYDPASMPIVSTASCTTNCLAPLAKLLDDNFGIIEGIATTIHAVTASQNVVDGARGRDWRAGRSVLNNIIPATTGAAKTLGEVLPELKGRLSCVAFRVPGTTNIV